MLRMESRSGFDSLGDRVSYTLECSLESVNQAAKAVEEFAAASGFGANVRYEISMATWEALINAVLHGGARECQRAVQLTCERKPGALEITVRDQGQGFDFEHIPDPLAPENLLKPSGRGIFLIRKYMDEVQFRNLNPGTEIILIRRVRGAAAVDVEEKAP